MAGRRSSTIVKNRHRNGITKCPRRHLLKRLEDILNSLDTLGMIHGDSQAANSTLKLGEEDKVLLIDFDWAGKAGEVRYPITRSGGLGYPGRAGSPLAAG